MPTLRFLALETSLVTALRNGGTDANGQRHERVTSDDDSNRCRHCLANIRVGEAMLIVAHRPFPALQPYAEAGPIFLHARDCARYADEAELPTAFHQAPAFLMRGYDHDDRIVYGTGAVVETAVLPEKAAVLLERPDIAYLHVRSARYNCYQCRIERA